MRRVAPVVQPVRAQAPAARAMRTPLPAVGAWPRQAQPARAQVAGAPVAPVPE
jgi:hypothetical protein